MIGCRWGCFVVEVEVDFEVMIGYVEVVDFGLGLQHGQMDWIGFGQWGFECRA